MAYLGGLRATRLVLATLQEQAAGLNVQLGRIQAELGDGLQVPGATSWYLFERERAFSPSGVDVAVFSSERAFPRWSRELSSRTPENPGSIHGRYGVEVVLGYRTIRNQTPSAMYERGERYIAALVRTLRNRPTLVGGDGSPCLSSLAAGWRMDRYEQLWEQLARSGAVGVSVVVELVENAASEGEPKSAGLPRVGKEVVR